MTLAQEKFIFLICSLCFITIQVDSFSILHEENQRIVKRNADRDFENYINTVGNLKFSTAVNPLIKQSRTFRVLFVFDKDASADLKNRVDYANLYAAQLARLASKYMAHANIQVLSAGVELWSMIDKISFSVTGPRENWMPTILERFQDYLKRQYSPQFGTTYTVGVLLANKNGTVSGGYTQGPPCATSGAVLMNYRSLPWTIGGLLAHELAHSMSVVHPVELNWVCDDRPPLSFCKSEKIPDECLCATKAHPAEQCLMTFSFGRATVNAPQYTSCDIEMMNFYTSDAKCLNS